MIRYILASLGTGIVFIVLDAILNANPLAQRLHQAYEPIARTALNPLPAVAIDMTYGFFVCGLYLMIRPVLPGRRWPAKAAAFAGMLWFLRVVMAAMSHWVMFNIPATAHLYDVGAGPLEMLVIAAMCAAILRP